MTMKMKSAIVAAALSAALLGLAGQTQAQGLLDQQLGGEKPAAGAADKGTGSAAGVPGKDAPDAKDAAGASDNPAPDKKDAPQAKPVANPGGPDIISPDAVKKVDDDDLIRQLTKPGDEKKMDADKVAQVLNDMMDRMGQSQGRLSDKDPGEVTQETQRRILTDLDVMIEFARQQRQQSKPGPPQPPQQAGAPQPSSGSQQGPNSEGGNTAAASSHLPGGGIANGDKGDLRNTGEANWGDLPPRDRAQVSHGANEEGLPAYKEMIDRYYQALAEQGKTRNR